MMPAAVEAATPKPARNAARAVASTSGADPVTMLHVHIITTSYIRGFAINLEMEAEARQESGITDQEWLRTQHQAVADMFATGSFPLLARSTAVPGAAFDLDRMFEFGLTRVLDGVGVLIGQQAAG